MKELNYHYSHHPGKEHVFLVLHGVSEGISSDFIQSIYTGLAADSDVLAMDFPYLAAKSSPSDNLNDEVLALQTAVEFLRKKGYATITIVAKSLGGIVASSWLERYPEATGVTLDILGYVVGDVATAALSGRLGLVIQGERDRFGDATRVRAELAQHEVTATVRQIAGADHSYRNESGEPVYQQAVVDELLSYIAAS